MAVDITPNKDGGVLKEILIPGDGLGTPNNGNKVKAHYHGTLTDGTVFDSSVTRGDPFEFTLGTGMVIKAWDLGVATMTKGEKAKFTCKAEYAYGERGSPPKIPGGATLVFEIELLSWQEEDLSKAKDGGILRSILEPGSGISTPAECRECKVQISGSYGGKVFDEREVSFTLGEGADSKIPRGLEKAIEKMKEGEKSKITLSPLYGWPDGHTELGIPPNTIINYIVKLLAFEKDKEAWDMDASDKIKEAELLKARATEHFKAEKYKLAQRLYSKALGYIESDTGFSEEEDKQRVKLLLAIHLNNGLVFLKLKEPVKASNSCNKALELDPNNVKGLFRRGQANLSFNEPEAAKVDFERVVELEPNNTAARAQITACINKIKEMKAKEKQIYSNMFDRLARKDKEDHFRFGWWDESQKKPIISEIIPEDVEDIEEKKREKKRQLMQLKRIAEEKRKEKEERERLAREKGEIDGEKKEETTEKVVTEEVINDVGGVNKESSDPIHVGLTESGVDNKEEIVSEEQVNGSAAALAIIAETKENNVTKEQMKDPDAADTITAESIGNGSANQ